MIIIVWSSQLFTTPILNGYSIFCEILEQDPLLNCQLTKPSFGLAWRRFWKQLSCLRTSSYVSLGGLDLAVMSCLRNEALTSQIVSRTSTKVLLIASYCNKSKPGFGVNVEAWNLTRENYIDIMALKWSSSSIVMKIPVISVSRLGKDPLISLMFILPDIIW